MLVLLDWFTQANYNNYYTCIGILSEDDVNLFRPTPEGKRKRQVDQPLPPIFFEDLNITDEVRMACEGNPACMFDLTITGNMEVAMETLNHDEEGNMTIATISKTCSFG